MRISDWSSDVCSSDLAMSAAATGDAAMTALAPERPPVGLLLLAGLLALAIGVGGFGGWAAYAPLSSAAVARGVITVEGIARWCSTSKAGQSPSCASEIGRASCRERVCQYV